MQELITSYLFQHKECVLPGIGTLRIKYLPASVDVQGKQILPPENEIIFSEKNHSKPEGLIKFIADKKHISINEANDLVNNFFSDWKERINNGESLKLETVGLLKKDNNGKIIFEKESNSNFLKPVAVKEIYQAEKNVSEEENIIPEEVTDYKDEQQRITKSYWVIWAAVLTAIAFGLIIFYYINNKTSSFTNGNQNKLSTDSSSATYSIP